MVEPAGADFSGAMTANLGIATFSAGWQIAGGIAEAIFKREQMERDFNFKVKQIEVQENLALISKEAEMGFEDKASLTKEQRKNLTEDGTLTTKWNLQEEVKNLSKKLNDEKYNRKIAEDDVIVVKAEIKQVKITEKALSGWHKKVIDAHFMGNPVDHA